MGILRFRKDEDLPTPGKPRAPVVFPRLASIEERHLLLEDLFRAHAARVLDYARNRGATLAEAEDVVSEVFIVLTRRLSDAPLIEDEIIPWLLTVARKILGNHLRSTRRRQALVERTKEEMAVTGQGQRDLSSTTTDNIVVRDALARLPEKEREALLLTTWDGFKYDEAALILECTPGAVAQRVLRARKLILEEIGDIRTYRHVEARSFPPVEWREE